MNAGIDRFGTDDREAVRRAQRDLRLEPALAREVLSTAARKAFQVPPRSFLCFILDWGPPHNHADKHTSSIPVTHEQAANSPPSCFRSAA